MPWGVAAAAVAAGGAIIGSSIGANASQNAAQTQANSANAATAAETNMFNTNQQNVAPWLQSGQSALGSLNSFMGLSYNGSAANPNAPGAQTNPYSTFQPFSYNPASDPAYQFNLNQGLGAITNQQSALGGVQGGNTMQALNNYAQGAATSSYQQEYGNYETGLQNQQQEYNNWNTNLNNTYSMLSGMSGTGANAALGVAGIGTTVGGQIGSNIIGAGNAQAAGQIGSANAYSNGIQSLFNNPSWMSSLSGNGNANANANMNYNYGVGAAQGLSSSDVASAF